MVITSIQEGARWISGLIIPRGALPLFSLTLPLLHLFLPSSCLSCPDKKQPALIQVWFAQQNCVPMGVSPHGRKADTRDEILSCCPYFCLPDQTDRIFPPARKCTTNHPLIPSTNQTQQINGWKWRFRGQCGMTNKQCTVAVCAHGWNFGHKMCESKPCGLCGSQHTRITFVFSIIAEINMRPHSG